MAISDLHPKCQAVCFSEAEKERNKVVTFHCGFLSLLKRSVGVEAALRIQRFHALEKSTIKECRNTSTLFGTLH